MKNGDSEKRGTGEMPECFVIMPIGEKPGYSPNHFERVFLDIFAPACGKAGFKAVHAGQVKEANLIHLDVLQRLLNAPMVLCDLSTHNPNVLFELGIRQAFDKPAVLVQEAGTGKIFDIAPIRVETYRRERIFNEVLEDQAKIAQVLQETLNAKKDSINSIVRLLGLNQAARIPEPPDSARDPTFQLLMQQMELLRQEIRQQTDVSAAAVRIEGDRFDRMMLKGLNTLQVLRNGPRQISDTELANLVSTYQKEVDTFLVGGGVPTTQRRKLRDLAEALESEAEKISRVEQLKQPAERQ